MAIQPLNTIKSWFKTGLKPSQNQFWDTWDSFRHKFEKVPIKDVENLEITLNQKAEKSQLDAHQTDLNAHSYLFAKKEDNANKGVANGYVPLDEVAKIASQYLDIVNDLVSGGSSSLLSAEQGKVLQNQINGIHTLLRSDNVNLDTLQEIVDAIEEVQMSLSTILVNDLTTGGATKALTAEMGKKLNDIKLTATIATDTEIQTSTSVIEDNKVVSRSKLFNWWEWIKKQSQTISAIWDFSKGLKSTGPFDMVRTRPVKASNKGWFQGGDTVDFNVHSYSGSIGNVQGLVFNAYQDKDDQTVFRQVSNGNQYTLGAGKFDFKGNGQKFIWSMSPVYVQGLGKDEIVSFVDLMNLANTGRLILEGGTQSGLTINADNILEPITMAMYSNDTLYGASLFGKRYLGTKALPTKVVIDTVLFGIYGAGYDGSNMSTNVAAIRLCSKETFSSNSKATYIDFATTSSGGVARVERMRLDDNGDLLIGKTTNNGLGKLQVEGNISAKGLNIPSNALVTVPINGLIERDQFGQLWETHSGVRSRLITTADNLICLSYKSLNTIETNINTNVSTTAQLNSSSTTIGKIANDSVQRLSLTNQVTNSQTGSVKPTVAKIEVFLKINNGLFATHYVGSNAVNQVKIIEFSGTSLNLYANKDYQNSFVTALQSNDPLTAQWSTIDLVTQSIINDVITETPRKYYLRDAANTRAFGAAEASFSFVFVNTLIYDDATNANGLNAGTFLRNTNYALFIETIR